MLINFLNKAPDQIKQLEFPGQPGVTCLSMMCSLVAKTFELSQLEEDEMVALPGISLANAILENVKDVGQLILPGILDLYLASMQSVDSPDLEVMLLQGFMVCFWYDCATTLQHLEQRQATTHIIQKALDYSVKLTQDFEVKKFILGLTSLLVSPTQFTMPSAITSNT